MRKVCSLLGLGVILCAALVQAQDDERGPDSSTHMRVPGVEVLAVPGKPFRASTSTEWTRTLADGSSVTEHLTATLARDRRGRVYRERHSFVAGDAGSKSPLNEVHIMDPLAQIQIYCSTRAMECVVTDYRPTTYFHMQPAGIYDNGKKKLERESLGTDEIEGIRVTGTRETTTVAAGAEGNDQPVVMTREFWYSEELATNLAVTRDNPLTGKQVVRLSQIVVGDPDSHLFDPPIGYRVRDLRVKTRPGH